MRASVGGEYEINEHWTVGGSYTFIWLGDNKIDQTLLARRVVGDYDGFVHVFGLYGSWSY